MQNLVAGEAVVPRSVVAVVAALDLLEGPIVAVEAAGTVVDIGFVVDTAAGGTGYQNIAIEDVAAVADNLAAVAAGNPAGVAIALPDIGFEVPLLSPCPSRIIYQKSTWLMLRLRNLRQVA